jgi:hypothetical protein
MMTCPYPVKIEEQMRRFYQSLSEKDRRRYVAIESLKLGHGGKTYLCTLLGCDVKTLKQGLEDLEDDEALALSRIRQTGGGRKKTLEQQPDIDEVFLRVIRDHTAGLPTDEQVKWTNLSRPQIVDLMVLEGIQISIPVVDQLLEKHDFRKRQAFKSLPGGQHKDRDAQFQNIQRLVKEYQRTGNPYLSMDGKKKELIGEFFREGTLYTQERVHVQDHDFRSLADGIAIPHGLYDSRLNRGYITIGTSHDTSEFACDCLRHYWYTHGRRLYPNATSLLLLCDGGGSNSSHYYVFKEQLQWLADELGIEIRIAHYPPYTSKYNPIEHRLFPHVSRACRGLIFRNIDIVVEAMGKAFTKTGLRVVSTVLDTVYQTGKKVAEGFKEQMKIVFDAYLPKWNYRAVPSPG